MSIPAGLGRGMSSRSPSSDNDRHPLSAGRSREEFLNELNSSSFDGVPVQGPVGVAARYRIRRWSTAVWRFLCFLVLSCHRAPTIEPVRVRRLALALAWMVGASRSPRRTRRSDRDRQSFADVALPLSNVATHGDVLRGISLLRSAYPSGRT